MSKEYEEYKKNPDKVERQDKLILLLNPIVIIGAFLALLLAIFSNFIF